MGSNERFDYGVFHQIETSVIDDTLEFSNELFSDSLSYLIENLIRDVKPDDDKEIEYHRDKIKETLKIRLEGLRREIYKRDQIIDALLAKK